MTAVLEVRDLSRRYGATRALHRVSLEIGAGSVCALMGRNGAGKSTLVRILSGVEHPDGGQIVLRGEPVRFRDPNDALAAGIATVQQENSIVPSLSVVENVMLGRWATRSGLIARGRNRENARRALDRLGVDLPLDRLAGDLKIAEQQLVEIARAISYEPGLLILDEPTSSLTETEAERLQQVVRNLAAHDVAVIYVSHRMDEIERIADTVTVFRDGEVVGSLPIAEAPTRTIAAMMVGTELLEQHHAHREGQVGNRLLTVRGLSTREKVRDVDLDVHAGEVVGLAGRLGAGRTEILRAIAGLDAISHGSVTGADGTRFGTRRDVAARVKAGIALLPEDRKRQGLVLNQSIQNNLVLSKLRSVARAGLINSRRQKKVCTASRSATEIKAPDLSAEASSLSGGNQQKVVLARLINADADVLLLDEPTRGVDIHAKQQVYAIIAKLTEAGRGVVIVSSEYGELLNNCDRILLVDDGAVCGELPPDADLADLVAAIMASDRKDSIA